MKTYKSLEKGRNFHTIWCELSSSINPFLGSELGNISKYCEWTSLNVSDEKNSKNIPHISLKYLGFVDEISEEKILSNQADFLGAISDNPVDSKITVRKIYIWSSPRNDVHRLNLEILDDTFLRKIHKNLCMIEGYSFIENLEGDNYSPHISLGSIDLSVPTNLQHVKEYLSNQEYGKQEVGLRNFAINLAYPKKPKRIELR